MEFSWSVEQLERQKAARDLGAELAADIVDRAWLKPDCRERSFPRRWVEEVWVSRISWLSWRAWARVVPMPGFSLP